MRVTTLEGGGEDVGRSREKTYCSFFSRIMELTCQTELCLSPLEECVMLPPRLHPPPSLHLPHLSFHFALSLRAFHERRRKKSMFERSSSFRPTDKKDFYKLKISSALILEPIGRCRHYILYILIKIFRIEKLIVSS